MRGGSRSLLTPLRGEFCRIRENASYLLSELGEKLSLGREVAFDL
jgi:hypothetical protein